MTCRHLAWVLLLASASAAAQPTPAPAPEPTPEPSPDPSPEPSPAGASTADTLERLERRLDEVERQNQELTDKVGQLEDDAAYNEGRLDSVMPALGRVTGYLDFGFFATGGDGAGTRTNLGNAVYPGYAGKVAGTWVFLGDPLSTAINARGEPADTGESRALTFDSVNSGGKASFIVNTLNLALFGAIGKHATLNASVDFVPRERDPSNSAGDSVGDFLDVKLAYLEWMTPVKAFPLSLFVGKFDSVVGFEYRSQDAPDRTGVTPSLLCRYTCGRPLGLKLRGRFLDDRLVANLALTNGSHFSESFPFSNEIDRNDMKTAALRLSYRLPMKSGGLELGASGALGAQDLQPEDDLYQWHIGGDLHLELNDLEFTGEYVKGKAPGKDDPAVTAECAAAPCLTYQGAYGLLAYHVTNMLVPYARVDWRDAVHLSGASFAYESHLLRATGGLRVEIEDKVVVKAEYTLNRELGALPQFDNDVFTTSMVVKF